VSNNDIKIVLVAKHSKNEKFENLLKQVFPQEIPVQMIDSIIIEFRDGTSAKLDHSELADPLPTSPNAT
jgi:tRNA G18 (ribose-2'-O)-methylase SpoU